MNKSGTFCYVRRRSAIRRLQTDEESHVHQDSRFADVNSRRAIMAKRSGGGKNYRSAVSGQFVKKSTATRNPSTTVGETRGGGSTGGTHRSAKTGKFVTSGYAKRNPSTTIRDS